jgi:hypothetical protein
MALWYQAALAQVAGDKASVQLCFCVLEPPLLSSIGGWETAYLNLRSLQGPETFCGLLSSRKATRFDRTALAEEKAPRKKRRSNSDQKEAGSIFLDRNHEENIALLALFHQLVTRNCTLQGLLRLRGGEAKWSVLFFFPQGTIEGVTTVPKCARA